MPPPTIPAGASGPGKFSQRTDSGGPSAASAQPVRALPNAKYGENKDYTNLQKTAPLSKGSVGGPAQAAQVPSGPPGGGAPPLGQPTQGGLATFSMPSQRPNEPVTTGATMGPGAGPEVLGLSPAATEAADMNTMSKNMPVYEYLANLPDAMPSARLMVNLLKTAS